MGFTVVASASSHARIASGQDWLKARRPAEELLIIGPTLVAANEIARSVTRAKGASFGHHRMTLGQLASTLARPALTAQNIVPLGTLGVQAVANRTIQKLAEAGALGRYAKLTDGPGFARAIANTITELRLEQIEPDALTSVASDLCNLLRAYERELADHAFADWPGVLRLAVTAASDRANRHQLLGLPTLLLDVAVTTASELAIVRALSSRSSEMLVTAPTNDTTTLARLRTGLGVEIVDLDSRATSQERQKDGALRRVQRHLFNDAGPSLAAQLDDQVAIFSAPGESRECVEIVRRVLVLAREGVALDRIAVLLRSSQEYQSHLEEAFGRANVPVYFTRGAVRPDPAGRAFHALLCCAAENLSARRFARGITNPTLPSVLGGEIRGCIWRRRPLSLKGGQIKHYILVRSNHAA
jgi:ATP-dependent helicase/DNAse subunit B